MYYGTKKKGTLNRTLQRSTIAGTCLYLCSIGYVWTVDSVSEETQTFYLLLLPRISTTL